jgi:pimeloyl-ACP methyl ester carboxylesterase
MPEGFAPVPGGELYYEESGEGPAVVLGHAGIADHTMWDAQVDPFSERYRVVRYDLRGFGRSSTPETDYAPHDDVRALLAHLNIDRAAVVGVSMSGGIAVDFALAHPEMLWALVPVAAGMDGYDWSAESSYQGRGALTEHGAPRRVQPPRAGVPRVGGLLMSSPMPTTPEVV